MSAVRQIEDFKDSEVAVSANTGTDKKVAAALLLSSAISKFIEAEQKTANNAQQTAQDSPTDLSVMHFSPAALLLSDLLKMIQLMNDIEKKKFDMLQNSNNLNLELATWSQTFTKKALESEAASLMAGGVAGILGGVGGIAAQGLAIKQIGATAKEVSDVNKKLTPIAENRTLLKDALDTSPEKLAVQTAQANAKQLAEGGVSQSKAADAAKAIKEGNAIPADAGEENSAKTRAQALVDTDKDRAKGFEKDMAEKEHNYREDISRLERYRDTKVQQYSAASQLSSALAQGIGGMVQSSYKTEQADNQASQTMYQSTQQVAGGLCERLSQGTEKDESGKQSVFQVLQGVTDANRA